MVFLFFIILILSIILLKIKVQIKNLDFSTKRIGYLNNNYLASITIFILNFIPILKINITKDKLKQINIKSKIKTQMKKDNIKTKLKNINLKILKVFIPKIKQLELKIKFGLEDAAITAFAYSILKTVLVNILKKDVYVEAIFENKNQLNIYFEGIFEWKLIHIINNLIIYNKDRRVNKNERTSNRRTYAYSNE